MNGKKTNVILEDKVTIIMTSYMTHDFTLSALWAIWKYYPNIKVIITDGSHAEYFSDLNNKLQVHFGDKYEDQIETILLTHACTEDCRNVAAALVDTPYILFMDADAKILSAAAIPLVLEPLEVYANCVQSGAYGYVCLDRKKRIGCVGKNFRCMRQLSASPAYFSIHLTQAYRDVNGMPKQFYYDIPKPLWQDSEGRTFWQPGWSGDFTITDSYNLFGLVCMSPKTEVPVLHWGQTNRYINQKRPVEDFWYANVRHINCDPMDKTQIEAAMKEEGIDGDYQSLFTVQPRFSAEDDL